MTAALFAAAAALGQMFHCSAAPEVATTLAPTPTADYISIANNKAQSFSFDISMAGNDLKITSADDHAIFGKGTHQFLKFSGKSDAYHSIADPCELSQQPCGSSVNLQKNTSGDLAFIGTTMWAVQLVSNPSGQKFLSPALIVIHGNCKPAEEQK